MQGHDSFVVRPWHEAPSLFLALRFFWRCAFSGAALFLALRFCLRL
jgi:hypothetical protein